MHGMERGLSAALRGKSAKSEDARLPVLPKGLKGIVLLLKHWDLIPVIRCR